MQTQYFEHRVGEAVAQAALTCAKGLGEYGAGINQPGTRAAMVDRIIDLHLLWREAHNRNLRFGDIVGREGTRAIIARAPELSGAAAALLLDMTLDLFRRCLSKAVPVT